MVKHLVDDVDVWQREVKRVASDVFARYSGGDARFDVEEVGRWLGRGSQGGTLLSDEGRSARHGEWLVLPPVEGERGDASGQQPAAAAPAAEEPKQQPPHEGGGGTQAHAGTDGGTAVVASSSSPKHLHVSQSAPALVAARTATQPTLMSSKRERAQQSGRALQPLSEAHEAAARRRKILQEHAAISAAAARQEWTQLKAASVAAKRAESCRRK